MPNALVIAAPAAGPIFDLHLQLEAERPGVYLARGTIGTRFGPVRLEARVSLAEVLGGIPAGTTVPALLEGAVELPDRHVAELEAVLSAAEASGEGDETTISRVQGLLERWTAADLEEAKSIATADDHALASHAAQAELLSAAHSWAIEHEEMAPLYLPRLAGSLKALADGTEMVSLARQGDDGAARAVRSIVDRAGRGARDAEVLHLSAIAELGKGYPVTLVARRPHGPTSWDHFRDALGDPWGGRAREDRAVDVGGLYLHPRAPGPVSESGAAAIFARYRT